MKQERMLLMMRTMMRMRMITAGTLINCKQLRANSFSWFVIYFFFFKTTNRQIKNKH